LRRPGESGKGIRERSGCRLRLRGVLAAVAGPTGPAARLLGLLEAGWFTLYVSDHVLAELGDVSRRPKVRAKNRAITDDTTAELLERLARLTTNVSDVPNRFCPETRTTNRMSISPWRRTLTTW
jgi:hypothetical protein